MRRYHPISNLYFLEAMSLKISETISLKMLENTLQIGVYQYYETEFEVSNFHVRNINISNILSNRNISHEKGATSLYPKNCRY